MVRVGTGQDLTDPGWVGFRKKILHGAGAGRVGNVAGFNSGGSTTSYPFTSLSTVVVPCSTPLYSTVVYSIVVYCTQYTRVQYCRQCSYIQYCV